ncbi:Anchored repeat-type ABC transporter, ATP-binding subunit [Corynebacterium camporealensis]|uniref:Anchored repeat-type ABC transporter, ATP-binding subunit n=1 Tax=Corynebacterium camporealensis TaxID=161896 RepID=A0A0F6QZZ0_9CORY|nr:anchored repeat-type ABC transporter ATP-binding subunit [Corynebacterium camporealensis]AKE40138.1 anchored repeat-type ABC transporter, ATP-binding subunit [Corynebacterium camporealensis]AVH89210.1 Anchored repeat-type ABC transporter, ATP-binding subunit [Corynebacterium camporealensis]
MNNLTLSFDRIALSERVIIHDAHAEIAGGSFTALLGPNGAGKTTLLRAILGLIPARGRAQLGSHTGKALRRRTGYVPQKHEIAWTYPINVADCVLTGRGDLTGWWRRPSASDRDAAQEALETCGIARLSSRPIGELSGGQKQRVLVARALARRPELLILDEPFTGVDAPTEEALMELFSELAHGGATILMTTHNLRAAVEACDRVLLVSGELLDATAEPTAWQRAFGIGPDSALLRSVGVA